MSEEMNKTNGTENNGADNGNNGGEGNTNPNGVDGGGTQGGNDNNTSEPSLEEKLATLMAENAKLKKAVDKNASEASNYKKLLREKQTADEIAAQEKAEKELEREEKLKSLERELGLSKFEKSFLALGYNADQAHKASIAQMDGDSDTLFKLQSEVQQAKIKEAESAWLKSRGEVNHGSGDTNNNDDPFLKGFGK